MAFVVALFLNMNILVARVRGQGQAVEALAEAEAGVASAYVSIVHAEGAGGNVHDLVEKLNHAYSLLAEARAQYGDHSFDQALDSALRSREISGGVEVEAGELAVKAANDAEAASRFQIVVSVLAAGIVVVVGYLSWVRFKRFYMSRTLGMRPEVSADES